MEENLNPVPESVPEPKFFARGREFAYGGGILLLSILMCNFVFFGGFHLAFGIIAAGAVVCAWLYLKKSGHRFGWYEKTLLILSILICLGFGRSDDDAVKFFMLLFLFVAVNLALCIGAGQNRRSPQGAMSLLDAPRAFYRLGIGNAGAAGKGLVEGFRQGGAATRRIGAVGTGLLVSVPILAVMIVLLMSADAAFEGLMDLLPEFKLQEYIQSAFWGAVLAWVLYSRGVTLAKSRKPEGAQTKGKGINPLTVNTVLIMVCLLYVVYLFSQLAYFSGGLSGILPEEFTLAEYARRGFFEMSTLCTMNLGILCFTIWLIREESLPRLTKIAGSFLAAITVFLILTASAKMFLYIGSYGLTWSRVTTEVFMLWLALTTVLVAIRLFLPRFGYMKAVVLSAMVLGTLVLWVDVDSLVANYNVNAYRSGKLETVDVDHLDRLGAAAVPRLMELMEDDNPEVAEAARWQMNRNNPHNVEDMRQWNFSRAKADELLSGYHAAQDEAIRRGILELLDLDTSAGSIQRSYRDVPLWMDGKRMVRIQFNWEDREAFVQQLEEAGWAEAPVSSKMQIVLNRDHDLFQEFRDIYLNGAKKQGFWIFRDLHPEAKASDDPAEVLLREEYDFVLAYYDSIYGTLYLFQVDKPAQQTG